MFRKLFLWPAVLILIAGKSFLWAELSPPPGPPGPLMKSLDQVEPRIPITELPAEIGLGSYYLTKDLSWSGSGPAITVRGSGSSTVTLDFNGHSLRGLEGSGMGVSIWAQGGLTIRNGAITGFGGDAIHLGDGRGRSSDALIENMRLYGNNGHGIFGGVGTIIRHCVVTRNQGGGISSALEVEITDSRIAGNGTHGIDASRNVVIRNCSVMRNGEDGLRARIFGGENVLVTDSDFSWNGGHGIVVLPGATAGAGGSIIRSTASGNGGAGIAVLFDGDGDPEILWSGVIADNQVGGNAIGIQMTPAGGMIVRNSAIANSEADFDLAEDNQVGPIVSVDEMTDHPRANFRLSGTE